MFYRGFDGPLLRQRFLEGNDTHEIKLILAVSRNANAQRAKLHRGRKGLDAVKTKWRASEGVATGEAGSRGASGEWCVGDSPSRGL